MRVLLIKMSSLGDVVHALAGVTDAARAKPGIVFDWVVEEAYQEIPKWHPAVRRTILAPLRRWRKAPMKTVWSGELKGFRDELRRDSYDLVLDAQGLLKSAVVGQQARGPLAGRSARSAREPAAALLYKKRIQVDLRRVEVEQLRQLFARTIGYDEPRTAAEFGIDRRLVQSPDAGALIAGRAPKSVSTRESPYAVFLHGAAWESKLWAEERWTDLGKFVRKKGIRVLLPWGTEQERARAERIAEKIGGDIVDRLGISELARLLAKARFVVGLDTGLTHIAIAIGTRTVTLYGPSVPVYEKVAGGELVNLCSTASRAVDTSRVNTVALDRVVDAIAAWI
jgi:heptosyltransferase I